MPELKEIEERLSVIYKIGNKTTVDSSQDDLNKCIDDMMHEIESLREYTKKT